MNRDTVIALADKTGLFDYLDLEGDSVGQLILQNFAALVAAHEREAILDEWSDRVQSDLENGVKFLNEKAAEKWRKDYPQIADFAAAIRSRE